MTSRFFLRLIALMVTCCLVQEPVVAAGAHAAIARPPANDYSWLFRDQALQAGLGSYFAPVMTRAQTLTGYGFFRDYHSHLPNQPLIRTHAEHEEIIDSFLRRVYDGDLKGVSSPDSEGAYVTWDDDSTRLTRRFIENVMQRADVQNAFRELIDRPWAESSGKRLRGVARVFRLNHAPKDLKLPVKAHVSDRKAHLFYDARLTKFPSRNPEESLRLLHELMSDLGMSDESSLAFQILLEAWRHNQNRDLNSLLSDPQNQTQFDRELRKKKHRRLTLRAAYEEGLHVMDQTLSRPGGRDPHLLKKRSLLERLRADSALAMSIDPLKAHIEAALRLLAEHWAIEELFVTLGDQVIHASLLNEPGKITLRILQASGFAVSSNAVVFSEEELLSGAGVRDYASADEPDLADEPYYPPNDLPMDARIQDAILSAKELMRIGQFKRAAKLLHDTIDSIESFQKTVCLVELSNLEFLRSDPNQGERYLMAAGEHIGTLEKRYEHAAWVKRLYTFELSIQILLRQRLLTWANELIDQRQWEQADRVLTKGEKDLKKVLTAVPRARAAEARVRRELARERQDPALLDRARDMLSVDGGNTFDPTLAPFYEPRLQWAFILKAQNQLTEAAASMEMGGQLDPMFEKSLQDVTFYAELLNAARPPIGLTKEDYAEVSRWPLYLLHRPFVSAAVTLLQRLGIRTAIIVGYKIPPLAIVAQRKSIETVFIDPKEVLPGTRSYLGLFGQFEFPEKVRGFFDAILLLDVDQEELGIDLNAILENIYKTIKSGGIIFMPEYPIRIGAEMVTLADAFEQYFSEAQLEARLKPTLNSLSTFWSPKSEWLGWLFPRKNRGYRIIKPELSGAA